MNTRYSVWMDGKGPQDIDPTIYITDIKEKQPKQNMVTASQGLRGGTRLAVCSAGKPVRGGALRHPGV